MKKTFILMVGLVGSLSLFASNGNQNNDAVNNVAMNNNGYALHFNGQMASLTSAQQAAAQRAAQERRSAVRLSRLARSLQQLQTSHGVVPGSRPVSAEDIMDIEVPMEQLSLDQSMSGRQQ